MATPAGIEPATFSLEEGCWSNDFNGHFVGTAAIRGIELKLLFPAVGTGPASSNRRCRTAAVSAKEKTEIS